mmetsp:Transcript_3088/g.4735  ORF Transcript_3088/g.4735 Transcript_3088/m.4735 type:complete len:84 (-) Transcript_3088:177-428(-)|eukprot:10391579-Ditylum_brightwellii.AAC.1
MNRTALYRFGDGSPDVAQLSIVAKASSYPSIFTACRLLLGDEVKDILEWGGVVKLDAHFNVATRRRDDGKNLIAKISVWGVVR